MAPEILQQFHIDLQQNRCGNPWGYSQYMLTQVSRTFALNINVLKGSCRRAILLAYLYMRMADTIEDEPTLPSEKKITLLSLFSDAFTPDSDWLASIQAFQKALPASWSHSSDPNHFLCAHAQWSLGLLFTFKKQTIQAVCAGVQEMCGGMAQFTQRQESLRDGWFVIESLQELDQYCYYVAGLVGNMLCEIFQAQSWWITRSRYQAMRQYSVSFGLGLQMANIIKDIAEDSQRKVCFIPETLCQKHGISTSPELLLRPADDPARQAIIAELIQKAWNHLEDAIRYTLLIPITEPRIRLFCLWPLFMAAETLNAIGTGKTLFDPSQKVKITRSDVKRIVRDTTLRFYSAHWIQQKFQQLRQQSI